MLAFPFKFNRGPIRLASVNLGAKTVRVPTADLRGNRPGKTLLVTGGMDGDEYAGIQAAYRLIDRYADGNFAGRLLIVPIVNAPGFEAECSWNPMDRIYPKNVFPGRRNGSPTERLVHWLVSTQVEQADAWHDAHGGALTEGLNPFMWTYRGGVAEVDALAERLTRAYPAETVLEEGARGQSKAGQLARAGRLYVLAESGARGWDGEASVERHLTWIETTMRGLGMIDGELASATPARLLRHVSFYQAPFDGVWQAAPDLGRHVRAGDLLGAWRKIDGSGEHDVRALTDGLPLWWKVAPSMRRFDVLCALGRP